MGLRRSQLQCEIRMEKAGGGAWGIEDREALLEGLFASIHPVGLGNSWNGSHILMSRESSLLNTFPHSQACVLQKYTQSCMQDPGSGICQRGGSQ